MWYRCEEMLALICLLIWVFQEEFSQYLIWVNIHLPVGRIVIVSEIALDCLVSFGRDDGWLLLVVDEFWVAKPNVKTTILDVLMPCVTI